ncbi:hypothetical protein [Nocardioides sp.]|uniref:hypothetical protein n=1 Tax=Nocardioides sp. TaxID=35761 RepID=UPI0039E55531
MRRSRGERGQVTPALLAAVLGAFAIMVGMFTLARGSEQSARSDTAADAAALAAAKQWHVEALALLQASAGTPALAAAVGSLNFFQPVGGYATAAEFAGANGGDLEGYQWLPAGGGLKWVVQATVRQRDNLVDRGDLNSRSTSRVRVEATGGLCWAGSLGFELNDGSCGDVASLAIVCIPPTPTTPNEEYWKCPQAVNVKAKFKTERTLVDYNFL